MAIQTFQATIKKIDELSDNIRHYVVQLDSQLEFKTGQFVNIEIEDNGEKFMRPYSIASSPSNVTQLEFCIKLIKEGKVTPHLFKKKQGDKMLIKGPFGLFTLDKLSKEKIVMIATGTGIAPFMSMIDYLLENNAQKQITLMFGTRYDDNIIYKQKFEELEKNNPNFKYLPIVSRPTDNWQGRRGYAQDNLDFLDASNSEIYICGLPNMVDQTKDKLIQLGVAPELIHFEKY